MQLALSMARPRLRDLRLDLVALPLGDTFITQRNMIDPQVQAIQAGAEMARVGLLPLSGGRDFVHADIEAHVAELRAVCRMLDIEWAGLGEVRMGEAR